MSALEADFPSVTASQVAEAESWRKEVHRPATHTHKWWAQRLGSVFRYILCAAVTPNAAAADAANLSGLNLSGLTVFDPFAGSGTTLVEAAKLGASVIGFDINPVASLVQRQGVQKWDLDSLQQAYEEVERNCRAEIDRIHRTENGETVLYYFWVAVAPCSTCDEAVRLFSHQVFAKHAYPKKYPRAQAACPKCLAIVETTYDFDREVCPNGHIFTNDGAVAGARMTCTRGHDSRVIDALAGSAPLHQMYAKLVLGMDGKKSYRAIDAFDQALYEETGDLLAANRERLVLPKGRLEAGYNTQQAMRWGYNHWEQFFNARQLYSLGILATAIRDLDTGAAEREALATLFSGTLEFNNLFCSFKGEGTGAVRHMFSHHVLKPERVPLEAHPWGTTASSGSFSSLFKSRILRAHEYKAAPSDLAVVSGTPKRVQGKSRPLDLSVVSEWPEGGLQSHQAYIKAADSSKTDIPDGAVDLVITDPPYMDNVHYSELADFFHAWLREIRPYAMYPDLPTTRQTGEVQSPTPKGFEDAIADVWRECNRVMKKDGLLAFTFHQARLSGWVAVMRALTAAGYEVSAIQPVKGEMSTSVTKAGAKEPSNLDSVVVCRRRGTSTPFATSLDEAETKAHNLIATLIAKGVTVGAGDVRSVGRGCALSLLTYEQRCDEQLLAKQADEMASRLVSTFFGAAYEPSDDEPFDGEVRVNEA